MRKYILLALPAAATFLFSLAGNCQLVINGGTVTLGDNAVISVQGDLSSNASILGNGKIVMNGTGNQQMNLNGSSVSNLEINSAGNVTLAGDAKISGGLTFTNGKIQTSNFNFILGSAAGVTGAGAGKFVETNGTGQVRREVAANGNFDLPVGAGTNYMPLQYQLSGAAIGAGAFVGTNLAGTTHPSKPIRATDNLAFYWKPSYSGITGGTVNAVGTYEAAVVNGDKNFLNGIRYNGTDWSLTNSSINTGSNTITFSNVAASGTDLYAMDKFILLKAKAFLQGAYNAGTGLMTEALRTGGYIPTSDPYRTAPYNSTFTHVSNGETETFLSSILSTQPLAEDNIVDWVFVELRNTTTGNAGANVLQTRSALLQRDGDIVDIDGVSPLMFKNVNPGSYTIAVRHRNHLGIATDPLNNLQALSEATTSTALDFTTATDNQINGPSDAYNITNGKNMLWGGNANGDSRSRYQGASNDRATLLSALSSNELSVINGYDRADLNMNGSVKYQGGGNDRAFLLATVLANGELTVRTQYLP